MRRDVTETLGLMAPLMTPLTTPLMVPQCCHNATAMVPQ
jgi:hypothetical protein